MSTDRVTVQQICEQIQDLPEESLNDLAKYVEFLRFKTRTEKPLRIIKLSGLWAGHEFTSEEIDQFRRELWAGFGEREL